MSADLQQFARDLRRLRISAGITSQRRLAALVFVSHTTVWAAERGEKLPSLELTLDIVRACGGDVEEWTARWRAVYAAAAEHRASPWPAQEVADGNDPMDSGCDRDAITVQAARVSLADRRHIIGQLELRYSPRSHAAWGRFHGEKGLDWLAGHRHRVDLTVGVGRQADDRRLGYRTEYGGDNHWGDILITGNGAFFAWAAVRFDGSQVAYGETDLVVLA